jgi:hypothetical protein
MCDAFEPGAQPPPQLYARGSMSTDFPHTLRPMAPTSRTRAVDIITSPPSPPEPFAQARPCNASSRPEPSSRRRDRRSREICSSPVRVPKTWRPMCRKGYGTYTVTIKMLVGIPNENRGAISGTPRRFVPYLLVVFARLEIEPPPARGPETQKPPLRWLFVFPRAALLRPLERFRFPVQTESSKLVAAFPFKKSRTSRFSAALTRSENARSPLFGHFCS